MKVAEGMSRQVLTIGPAHTLREAARMMASRRLARPSWWTPSTRASGILTERDILNSVAAGESPDAELAAQHCTQDLVFAAADWTLEDAAAAMVRGGFRHLVVVDGQRSSACCPCETSSVSGPRARLPPQAAASDSLIR